MYVGEDVFQSATTRDSAKTVFAKSVSRVEVETHSFCNRRCNYCPNVVGDRLGQNKQMHLDHWKMILSDLAEIDFSGNFVFTSYNEPLADRSILERLAEARAACPKARLIIYTNGDYLNAAYLDEIASAGLDYLHVSIHTRHNGQYSDVDALNLISKLERRVQRPITYQTLRPGNFVIAVMPHPSLEVEVRAINYNQHGTDRAGLVDVVKTPPARTAPCHFPFAHFHVGFSGNVTPCCHIRSDAAEHAQFLYGNLSEFGSIYEVWASQVGAAWRRELISSMPKRSPCNTCSVGFLDGKERSRAQAEFVWRRLVAAGVLQSTRGEAVPLEGNIGGAS